MSIDVEQKKTLRKRLKQQRRALKQRQLDDAAQQLFKNSRQLRSLLFAKKIFSYAASAGEISANLITASASQAHIYLPYIQHYRQRRMYFYSAGGQTSVNRYGITEPVPNGSPMPVSHADVVLVPLLAFDRAGNRMGLGGGFYDTALAYRHWAKQKQRPLLVGLAHHFQEVESLQPESWDVCLDVILTDRELIHCR